MIVDYGYLGMQGIPINTPSLSPQKQTSPLYVYKEFKKKRAYYAMFHSNWKGCKALRRKYLRRGL